MKRYPAYKDTRVDWIGDIPDNWEHNRLKYLSKVRLSNIDKKSNEGETPVRLCNYVDVYYNEKITSGIEFMDATAPKEKIEDFTLQKGDVLITKDSETPDDIAVPAYVLSSLPGVVCGYHLALIRPNNGYLDGNYLFRSFVAQGIRDQFEIAANGITRFGIGKYSIDNSVFLAPPIEDQRKIANYLDYKTRLIDTLIEKKRKQIALLLEQRAAIINQAVKKGLDPNVKMKDSEIEWLGEVPEHWEVKQLKHLSTNGLKNGVFKKKDRFGSGTKLINVINLFQEDYKIKFDQLERVELSETEIKKYGVVLGDILFVRSSLKIEGVGVSACIDQVPELAVFECHVVCMRPNADKIDYRFLINFLNSFHVRHRLVSLAETVTMATLSQPKISSLEVLVPPVHEQNEIVEHIDKINSFIFRMVKNIKASIEKLNEYRTTLISEVVTGKIDVRDEAIP